MAAPSKYQNHEYVGKDNGDENGYKYFWDLTHPDLEPTETFYIGCKHYCAYCCQIAHPIQAHLNHPSLNPFGYREEWDYEITGYTCICDAAEAEKKFRSEVLALQEKHKNELNELVGTYYDILTKDVSTSITIKADYELKEAKRSKTSAAWEILDNLKK